MLKNDFVVALVSLKHVLSAIKRLSVALQAGDLELHRCLKYVNDFSDLLKRWRNDEGSGSFDNVFRDAEKVLGDVRHPSAADRDNPNVTRVSGALTGVLSTILSLNT